jgi:pimeloyl-ACP methyl ester carboxylesterase
VLPQIRVPVLYISGSRDRQIMSSCAEDFQTLGGPFQLATVDAPHLILQARPAPAARLIEQFLGSLSMAGGTLSTFQRTADKLN